MKKQEKLLWRGYRITKKQDAKVKKTAKKEKVSEAEIIRNLIEKLKI